MDSEVLATAFIERKQKYLSLLSANKNSDWWDVVCISACDRSQAEWYERKIEEKKRQQRIPKSAEYIVIADPEHLTKSNGLATINAMYELHQQQLLSEKKVLLMHGGGYSGRLPQASIYGKPFVQLPCQLQLPNESIIYLDSFEVLLINFMEIPKLMHPGVFITGSDVFETFPVLSNIFLPSDRIVSLATPSNLDVASSHGVFTLENVPDATSSLYSQTACHQFLHKKPKSLLLSTPGASHVFRNGDKMCFTDGSYYIGVEPCKDLVNWYVDNSTEIPDKEIEAWRDFLFPMTKDFNEEQAEFSFQPLLAKRILEIVALFNADYNHIGTLREYITHFCSSSSILSKVWGIKNEICFLGGSTVHSSTSIQPPCVLDNTHISAIGVSIPSGCVLSNVNISMPIQLPKDCLLHTACIEIHGEEKFVTIAIGVFDDIKREGTLETLSLLQFSISSLFFHVFQTKNNEDLFSIKGKHNLWTLRLFKCCPTQETSLENTLELLKCFNVNENDKEKIVWNVEERFSMHELGRFKKLNF